jgi:hypothetical protein
MQSICIRYRRIRQKLESILDLVSSFRAHGHLCTTCFNITKLHIYQEVAPSKNLKIGIYKNIILPAVLYECETWSVTLREEQTEGVWEQGAEENIWIEEGWSDRRLGKLRNELYNLYCSPSIIRIIKSRRMRWAGHLGRDNIKMDLREREEGWYRLDWSGSR